MKGMTRNLYGLPRDRERIWNLDGSGAATTEPVERAFLVAIPTLSRVVDAGHPADAGSIVSTSETHVVYISIDVQAVAMRLAALALGNVDKQSVVLHGAVRARLDRAPFKGPVKDAVHVTLLRKDD